MVPTSLLPPRSSATAPLTWSPTAGGTDLEDLRASAALGAARGGVPALLALRWEGAAAPAAPAAVREDGRRLAERAARAWWSLAADQRDDDLSCVTSVLHAAGHGVLAEELADEVADELARQRDGRPVPRPRRPLPTPHAAGPSESTRTTRTTGGAAPAPMGMTSHLLALGRGHHLRVVSWHNTPPSRREHLRAELTALKARYRLWTLADLEAVTTTGTWPGQHDRHAQHDQDPRPGLLPVFYEGYRASAEVAAPVCEELGITGWFGVCTGFVGCRPDQQELFARAHKVVLLPEDLAGPSPAMTWDQVGALAQRHVVFAHTASHAGIEETPTDADLEREVHEPARALRAATGRDAGVFAWLHGSPTGMSERHDAALREAGYRHLVSATAVHRL
ncbi:polysaccharide deacetylase family protein [Quadrisphaera sp. KR29]|uniref:polysaccharide deacetylase family protein n=1 Tax=Quadrisphaera sp. KR29 TaxID=3461391 RepID=UPI0040441EFC